MDIFCVCTQIFLIMICLPTLDYLRTQASTLGYGCILGTYAFIPKNDSGLPTLDYLCTQPSTLGHGCILRTYADISKNDAGLPTLDYFAHMSKYLETWMYSAYIRRYS